MKIQILGTGCAKCGHLYQAAVQAVNETGVTATVDKVTDITEILEFTPWALPALAVDGKVMAAGQLLTSDQIKTYFPK